MSGNLPAAKTATARSIDMLSSLSRKDPGNSGWQNDFAVALTEQAAESLVSHEPSAARAQVTHAFHILEPQLAKHPDNRGTLLTTMTAKLLLAEVSTEPQSAQKLRQQALRTLQAVQVSRRDPRLQALQTEALLSLGREADAQSLLKQLWKSGYRDLGLLLELRHEYLDYPVNTAFALRLAPITHTDPSAAPQSIPEPDPGVLNNMHACVHRPTDGGH